MKFCAMCFASETSGSFNHVVIGDYCTNCGGGYVVDLPEQAIDSIRQQASWVGKRYYPCDEDRAANTERADLMAFVTEFPGRTAKLHTVDGKDTWEVTQAMPHGGSVSIFMPGHQTGAHAMRRAIGLRYIPQWRLDEAKKEQKS